MLARAVLIAQLLIVCLDIGIVHLGPLTLHHIFPWPLHGSNALVQLGGVL